MKRSTKYVAFDVHQATTVASVREQSGRVIDRTVLPTEASALSEYLCGMRGSIRVALEEGTQAQWLHDLLLPLADEVIVCDRRGEHRGNKNDRRDADYLSQRLLSGDLRAVYHGSASRRKLQELARTYLNLTEDTTRVMLRLKAIFRTRAIRTPGESLYSAKHRAEWLDRAVHSIFRTRARCAAACDDEDTVALPNKTQPLGICWTRGSNTRYGRPDFVGGRAVRRRRPPMTRGLNQNHNRLLKHTFKSAAVAALTRPGELRDLYVAMIERGMRPDMARVTLARKFAALTLRIWKTGEPYDRTKLSLGVQQGVSAAMGAGFGLQLEIPDDGARGSLNRYVRRAYSHAQVRV